MIEPTASLVEMRVLRQINELGAQIIRLENERNGLESFLMKLRQENKALREVNRRNSVNRVLFEEFVLNYIDKNKGLAYSDAIFRSFVKNHAGLNSSTFRSSIRRMKEKGLIRSVSRGLWARTVEHIEQSA